MTTMSQVRVMLVEADSKFRKAIEYLLLHSPANDVLLAASCSTAAEALQALQTRDVDVAVVDLELPDRPGIELIRALQRQQPPIPSLVLTVMDDSSSILGALQAGARGYLLKDIAPEELVAAIHQIVQGDPPLAPEARRALIEKLQDGPLDELHWDSGVSPRLTRREHEILDLFVRGHTYDCVADALGLALSTVQGHVKRLYKKLDVSSKAEAVVAALRLGWMQQ